MKNSLSSPVTESQVRELLARFKTAPLARVLLVGRKRADILFVDRLELVKMDYTKITSFAVGSRASAGLPFVPAGEEAESDKATEIEGDVSAIEQKVLDESKPRGPVGPPEKLVPGMTARVEQIASLCRQRSQVRNYTAFMDSLLLDLQLREDKPVEVEGYIRSKYTVAQALKAVLKRYPKKDAASVKRILKVRPRHLEKMKTLGAFDDAKVTTRAPRWAWVGPGSGVDFVNRIRKLLLESQRTPEKAAEIACREFGRELGDGVRIARNTLKKIKQANGTAGPSAQERKAKKTKERDALKAKNVELHAKRTAS